MRRNGNSPKELVNTNMARSKNCGRCRKIKSECNCGRPEVITKDVLQKLEEGFTWNLSDLEACLYAGISKSTLYNYQEVNPKFVERKEMLKKTVNLAVKKQLSEAAVKKDLNHAKWMAQNSKTLKEDFGTSTDIKMSGKVATDNPGAISPAMVALTKKYEEDMRKAIHDAWDKEEAKK